MDEFDIEQRMEQLAKRLTDEVRPTIRTELDRLRGAGATEGGLSRARQYLAAQLSTSLSVRFHELLISARNRP
jgi:hypothetical protein